MELNFTKKQLIFGGLGIALAVSVVLQFLPAPHHQTTVKTINSTKTTTPVVAKAPKTQPTQHTVISNVKTTPIALSTGKIKGSQGQGTANVTSNALNTSQSVAKLLGSAYSTVAVKATPTQALDGQFLGQLSQIMVNSSKGKAMPGVWVVSRRLTNNLLILSVKTNEISNLQKDISGKWFLAHNHH